MTFNELKIMAKEAISSGVNFLATGFSKMDEQTLILGSLATMFVLLLFAYLIVRAINREEGAAGEDGTGAGHGSAELALREIKSTLATMQAQIRENNCFVKQELSEVRSIMDRLDPAAPMEQDSDGMRAMLSSYSNLMREEQTQIRTELAEIRSMCEMMEKRMIAMTSGSKDPLLKARQPARPSGNLVERVTVQP